MNKIVNKTKYLSVIIRVILFLTLFFILVVIIGYTIIANDNPVKKECYLDDKLCVTSLRIDRVTEKGFTDYRYPYNKYKGNILSLKESRNNLYIVFQQRIKPFDCSEHYSEAIRSYGFNKSDYRKLLLVATLKDDRVVFFQLKNNLSKSNEINDWYDSHDINTDHVVHCEEGEEV